MGNATTSMGNDCSAADASKCKSDATNVGNEAKSFLADIGKLTVPACLSATNEELGAALEYLLDGTSEVVTGIDANDAAQITKAADLITLASDHIGKANALLSSHPCG